LQNGKALLASSAGVIQAATGTTFYTEGGNPIRKKGEELMRASVSIFPFSLPVQTATTSFVRISRHFSSTTEISLPEPLEGTTRVYKLAITYASEGTQAFDLRVVSQDGSQVYDAFQIPAQNFTDLSEGKPYLTDNINIPISDWQLEIRSPANKKIRIFQIYLVAYDKVN